MLARVIFDFQDLAKKKYAKICGQIGKMGIIHVVIFLTCMQLYYEDNEKLLLISIHIYVFIIRGCKYIIFQS